MRINELSQCVVQIEILAQHTKASLGSATGFICRFEGQEYLVTNLHVLSGVNTNTKKVLHESLAIPGYIKFSIPRIKPNENDASLFDIVDDAEAELKLYADHLDYEYGLPIWLKHPTDEKIDVAAIQINHLLADKVFEKFSTQLIDFSKPATLHNPNPQVMQSVFIIGYPLQSKLMPNRFPIYKSGSIATEPQVFNNGSYVLIDGKTKSGMSGSPVYLKKPDSIKFVGLKLHHIQQAYGFYGVYSGREQNDPSLTTAELGIVWPFDECIRPILQNIQPPIRT